jgi:hypothetical protein
MGQSDQSSRAGQAVYSSHLDQPTLLSLKLYGLLQDPLKGVYLDPKHFVLDDYFIGLGRLTILSLPHQGRLFLASSTGSVRPKLSYPRSRLLSIGRTWTG